MTLEQWQVRANALYLAFLKEVAMGGVRWGLGLPTFSADMEREYWALYTDLTHGTTSDDGRVRNGRLDALFFAIYLEDMPWDATIESVVRVLHTGKCYNSWNISTSQTAAARPVVRHCNERRLENYSFSGKTPTPLVQFMDKFRLINPDGQLAGFPPHKWEPNDATLDLVCIFHMMYYTEPETRDGVIRFVFAERERLSPAVLTYWAQRYLPRYIESRPENGGVRVHLLEEQIVTLGAHLANVGALAWYLNEGDEAERARRRGSSYCASSSPRSHLVRPVSRRRDVVFCGERKNKRKAKDSYIYEVWYAPLLTRPTAQYSYCVPILIPLRNIAVPVSLRRDAYHTS